MTFSRRGLFAFVAGLFAAKSRASIVVLSPSPGEAPLVSFIKQLKRKTEAPPSVEWHEEDYQPRWGQMAADAPPEAELIVTTNGSMFCPGDLVQGFWRDHLGIDSELFRVQSIQGNELKVARGAGATKAGYLAAGSALRIVGNVYA